MGESIGLKQMILNRFDDERGLATKMAKIAGYSSSGALVKVLKKTDGDIEKFDGFVRIVHELFPTEKFELMTRFAKTLNPNRMTARFMLEYCSVYRITEAKEHLINLMLNAENIESQDWAFVYSIDDLLVKGEIGGFEAISQLSQRRYASIEMAIFSKIVQFYSFYDMRNVRMMNTLCNEISKLIELVKNEFTKHTFYARLFLIEMSVDLHNSTTSKVKEKSFIIENALDPLKSIAYLQIGNSFMINKYDRAMEMFNKAMECATGHMINEINKSKNFLSIMWNKFDGYTSDGTLSNELFYHAKLGNKEKGIEVLSKINIEELSDQQKGFNYYYQGLLFNDKSLFYKSITHFNLCGDKFYKQLPIIELKKQNENPYVLEALMA